MRKKEMLAFCSLMLAAVVSGAEFRVKDTAASRLEALAGVETAVTVPVLREADDGASYFLVADGKTNAIDWVEGSVAAYPQVVVPALAAGTDFAVLLIDESEAVVAQTCVHIVEDPGNSIRNPWWIGERTAEELGYGEWTVDIDVARRKLSGDDSAHLLVRVSGDLWCPHCQASLSNLWETADFQNWAKENRVILVLVDQPDAQTIFPGYDYTDYEVAQGLLVNYNADSYARAGRYGASGASYLSRHGIDVSAARAVFERNKQLNMHDWLRPSVPESTKRNGMGTLILIDAEGNELCRPSTYSAGDTYPVRENLARLTAALGVTSVSATEPTWTDRSHRLGMMDSISLQVNDAKAYYRLTGLEIGRLGISYKARLGDEPVELSVLSGDPSDLSEVAVGRGEVSCDITADLRDQDSLWLRVRSFMQSSSAEYGDSNRISGLLTSTFTERPGLVAFTKKAFFVDEMSASGSVSVVRAGGAFGRCSARIVWTGGDAENGRRYDWKDIVVSWEDGEEGERPILFAMKDDGISEGRQSFGLTLCTDGLDDAAAGLTAPLACQVTVNDSTTPGLAQEEYEETFYVGFSACETYPVANLNDGRIKLLTDGSAPRGIRLTYDSRQGTVVLKGTAKAVGQGTVTVALRERRPQGYVYGQESRFAIVVKDPKSFNPMLDVSQKKVAIPLCDETRAMTGILTVSALSSGRISAAYSGIGGRVSFSGRWTDLDEVTGTAIAVLEKKGSTLKLEMTADGKFSARVFDADAQMLLSSADSLAKCTDISPFVGLYTVTLPVASSAEGALNSGTAVLAVSVKPNGKAAYKGTMPNGQSISGSCSLLDHGETAVLPVFVSKGKGRAWLGAALDIVPYAADEYVSGNPVIVSALSGISASWGMKQEFRHEQAQLEVYGGYYAKNFDLVTCCRDKYLSTQFKVFFDWSRLRCDDAVERMASGSVNFVSSGIKVQQADSGFSMKLTKLTGRVTGKTRLFWADGRETSVSIRGVVLPGWVDCGCTPIPPPERPLISGTAYFKVKTGGQSLNCSVPVDVTPIQ